MGFGLQVLPTLVTALPLNNSPSPKVVMDGIMALRASNEVLGNVWSYGFYGITLRHLIIATSSNENVY